LSSAVDTRTGDVDALVDRSKALDANLITDPGVRLVVAGLEDHQVIAVDQIHQPMLVGDAPRPYPRQQVS
jgi:hypothetical protein